MDLVWSILHLLRPWMGYDYIVIQIVCWVELPEQIRLISAQKMLFCTLINIGFEHFLCTNQPN